MSATEHGGRPSEVSTTTGSKPTAGPPLVRELSAITVDSTDLDAWERFGSIVVGATVLRGDGEVRLKIDGYPYRFLIKHAGRDGISSVSWLARDAAAVHEIEDRWERAGGAPAPPAEWASFGSDSANQFCFKDHQGIVHEVFADLPVETPFEPVPAVSGFLTGVAGLGHIVFFDTVERADTIFIDIFQMMLRGAAAKTQVGGRGHFYACNPRHHSVAAAEVEGRSSGVMHVMIEMLDLDDVGGALDRATSSGFPPRTSLGRRGDHVVSFYVPSPGGFDLEIGCGGLLIDDSEPPNDGKKVRSWGHAGLRFV